MTTNNTITIKNINFGIITVDKSSKLYFPEGLFGFENYHEYYLADVDIAPFLLLQEKDNEHIGFIVCDPFLFFEDYEFELDDQTLNYLKIKDKDDILILVIITLSDQLEDITANLLGPLVINRRTHEGIQYIINSEKYTTKHKLFVKE